MPATRVKSKWASGDLIFEQVNSSAAIEFGVNGTGLDIKFWGDTPSSYMLWDESANTLSFASGTTLAFGGSTVSLQTATVNVAAGGKITVASGGVIDLTGDVDCIIFKDGATSALDPGVSGSIFAGWLNFHVTAASTIVYVPYYASA